LSRHKKRLHKERERSHLCPDCGRTFYERLYLNEHIARGWWCTRLTQSFENPKLIIHLVHKMLMKMKCFSVHKVPRDEKGTPIKSFQCDRCPALFANEGYLKRHLKDFHKVTVVKEPNSSCPESQDKANDEVDAQQVDENPIII
jgi:uncharacterized Zn-finger protein